MTAYRPHAEQRRFHAEARRFASLAAGARGGKTLAAAREFCLRVYRDRLAKCGDLRYWCAAPTYSIGKVQQRELLDALGGLGSPLIQSFNRSERELRLHGDIVVEFKTTERPETLVAAGLDGLWVDEAARVKAEAWLGGLRMRLSDRQGWAVFSTTPLGRNWFFEHLVEPAQNGNAEFSLHSWKTVDNTAVPGLVAEVERARLTLPDAYFRREYEASFDAFIGQVYAELAHALHVVDSAPEKPAEVRYGLDWGFSDGHPGALVVLLRDVDGVWTAVEEIEESGQLITWWIDRAKEMIARYGDGIFFADPARPDNIRAMRQAGLKLRPADNDVAAGIATVAKLLHPVKGKPSLIFHRRCSQAIAEMTTYRWNDKTTKEQPVKKHDHTCDAIRYALHTRAHKPAQW